MAGAGEAEAMSMKFEGFSIREYVAKARSANVMKCWPFGGGASEKMVKNFLPPISVEKFRWWSHEFDLVKSEELRPLIRGESSKSTPSKPVKNFCGESTAMMRSVRAKRKKRSILEIFAEDEENDAQNLKRMALREVELGLKRKMMKERKNKKKPKLKDESEAKSYKQNVGLKLKKIIESERIDLKEKPLKVKLHSSVAITKKPINKSRFSKGFLKGTSQHIVSTNNKCHMKSLTDQQEKNNTPRISKSNGKNKKPTIVHGILKKYKEDILVKRSTLNSNPREDDCQRSLSLTPKSGRHVRFSGKDDVVSTPLKQLGSTPSLEEIAVFSASPLGAMNKRFDEMPLSSVNGADVPFNCDRPQRENLPETPELLNHVANLPTTEGHRLFGKSYGVASKESTYGIDTGYLPPPSLGRYGSNMSGIPSGSNAKKNQSILTDHFGTSSSYNIPSDGRAAFDRGTIPFDNSNVPSFPYGRYHHLTPKELMWSICSVPPDRKQREFTNGHFGLPLNSQGELIRMNSTGQDSFNQLMMPASSAATAPSSSTTASLDMWKNEEIRRKLNHLSFVEKLKQLAPSFIGLSTSHFEDSMRENIHHTPKGDDDITPAHTVTAATTTTTTPTIRLMGKEFTVSKLDKGNQEDERVWTDKEIIAEHRPPAANVVISDDNSASSESIKHNVGFMSKTQIATRTPLINGELHSYVGSPRSPFSSAAINREKFSSPCHDQSPFLTFPLTRTTHSSFSMNQCQQRVPFPLEFPFTNQDDNNNNSEELLQRSWYQTSVKKVNNLFDTGGIRPYNHHPYPNPYSFSRDNRQSMQPTIGVSYPQQQQQRLPFQAPFRPFNGGTPPGGVNRFRQDRRLMEPSDVRIRNRTTTPFEEKKWRNKRPASSRSIVSTGNLPCKLPNYNLLLPKVSNIVTSSSSSSVVEIEPFEKGNTIVSANNNNKKKMMMGGSVEKEVGSGRGAGPVKLSAGVKHVLKLGSNGNQEDIRRPILMHSAIISSSSSSSVAAEVSGSEKSAATAANKVVYVKGQAVKV